MFTFISAIAVGQQFYMGDPHSLRYLFDHMWHISEKGFEGMMESKGVFVCECGSLKYRPEQGTRFFLLLLSGHAVGSRSSEVIFRE